MNSTPLLYAEKTLINPSIRATVCVFSGMPSSELNNCYKQGIYGVFKRLCGFALLDRNKTKNHDHEKSFKPEYLKFFDLNAYLTICVVGRVHVLLLVGESPCLNTSHDKLPTLHL